MMEEAAPGVDCCDSVVGKPTSAWLDCMVGFVDLAGGVTIKVTSPDNLAGGVTVEVTSLAIARVASPAVAGVASLADAGVASLTDATVLFVHPGRMARVDPAMRAAWLGPSPIRCFTVLFI